MRTSLNSSFAVVLSNLHTDVHAMFGHSCVILLQEDLMYDLMYH